jgi:hypothetical protein
MIAMKNKINREAEIGRIVIGGQPRQKVHETPSLPVGTAACSCHPAVLGSRNRRAAVQVSPGIKQTLSQR